MASVLERQPANRHEQVIDGQLQKALARIRFLDLATGGLAFVSATLAFSLGMAILDRTLNLSLGARQFALALYALTVAGLLGWFVVRPLLRSINPFYAALQVEQTLPSAKNSIVNYLDLRDDPLAPAILTAVGQRAARDIGRTDLEQAISGRRAAWLGSLAGILLLAQFIALVFWGVPTFGSLLSRTFTPFNDFGITNRTRIEVKTKDISVPVNHAVTIAATISGKVPDPDRNDALKLHLRYRPGDPFEEPMLLEPESPREWLATVPVSRVQNGFWYKITGGDFETPEYRVTVRSAPMITSFVVHKHYRPYLGWVDKVDHDANLYDVIGTEIDLTAHVNRDVSKGTLHLEGTDKSFKQIASTPTPGDPRTMNFKLTLETSGVYRIRFSTTDSDQYSDTPDYLIKVIADNPPQVDLTRPASDTTLTPDGTLQLEGFASDDFGIKELTLLMKMENGAPLPPKPYRPGKSFLLGKDGGYPQMLDYKDFVELGKLKSGNGQALKLSPGQVIEYWLEAKDAFDLPGGPHVAQSKHYKVTIGEPAKEEKDKQEQKQANQQAKREQGEHEKNQDQKLDQQKQELAQKNEHQQQSNEAEGKAKNHEDGKGSDKSETSGQNQSPKDNESNNESKGEKSNPGKANSGSKDNAANTGDPNAQKSNETSTSDKSEQNKDSTGKTSPDGKNADKNQANSDKSKEGTEGSNERPSQGSQDQKKNAESDSKELAKEGDNLNKNIEKKNQGSSSEKGTAKGDPSQTKAEDKGPGQPQAEPNVGDAKEKSPSEGQNRSEAGNPETKGNPESQADKSKEIGAQIDLPKNGTSEKNDSAPKTAPKDSANAGNPKDDAAGKNPDRAKSESKGDNTQGPQKETGSQVKDQGKPQTTETKAPGSPKDQGTSEKSEEKVAAKEQPKADQKPGDSKWENSKKEERTAKGDAKDQGAPQKQNDKNSQESAGKTQGNDKAPATQNKTAKEGTGEKNQQEMAGDSKGGKDAGEAQASAKANGKPKQDPGNPGAKTPGKDQAKSGNEGQAKDMGQEGSEPNKADNLGQKKEEGKHTGSGADEKANAKPEKIPDSKSDSKNKSPNSKDIAVTKKGAEDSRAEKGSPGDAKPMPNSQDQKAESPAVAKGEKKQDPSKENDGGQLSDQEAKTREKKAQEEIQKLSEKTKSVDPDKSKAAERRLEDLAKDGPTEKARQQAKEALKQAKKDGEGNTDPGAKKDHPDKTTERPENGNQPGDPGKTNPKKTDDSKIAEKNSQDTHESKSPDKKSEGNPKNPGNKTEKTADQSNTTGPEKANDPNHPKDKGEVANGNPGDGNNPKTSANGVNQPDVPGGPGDARFREKAGDLQLRKLREALDKKLLNDEMSPEDKAAYKEWLRKYEAYKRNPPQDAPDVETGSTKPTPTQINNGVRQFKSPVTDKSASTTAASRGTAPPEFRDSFSSTHRNTKPPEK